jgi:hypothetical protein
LDKAFDAIDFLERPIQGGSQTHRSVDDKARDAGVAMLSIMRQGTISLWRLAAYVASAAQTASVQRRFYRFFQFVQLDGEHAADVVVELLSLSGFWRLIARTGILARPRSTF